MAEGEGVGYLVDGAPFGNVTYVEAFYLFLFVENTSVAEFMRRSCGFCVMFMWQWWCGGDVTVVWRSCGGGLT